MREALIGILGGVVVTACVLSASADHRDSPETHLRGAENRSDRIIALDGPNADGHKMIVVIDDDRQTMGSYLINTQTGQITLRCVRNFRWDLQMDEYNGSEPSPQKIQALLRSK
jgi:hypothetical protein